MTREEQIIEAAEKATYQEPPQYSELVHKARKVMCAYEVGFIDGCVWADSHPHWIPVEERLPKRMNEKSRFSETVLVYNKDGYKETAYYDFEEKIWRWMPSVTHWMPIVPPRKEDKK